jgi:hypothetical protein
VSAREEREEREREERKAHKGKREENGHVLPGLFEARRANIFIGRARGYLHSR